MNYFYTNFECPPPKGTSAALRMFRLGAQCLDPGQLILSAWARKVTHILTTPTVDQSFCQNSSQEF